MFSGPKKTPAEWSSWLRNEHEKMTIWEFMAGCLARSLAVLLEVRDATGHTEGMVGRLDLFASRVAHQGSTPYPSAVEALDGERDEQRRQALQGG